MGNSSLLILSLLQYCQQHIRVLRLLSWATELSLFVFILTTPFDNLIEIPHAVFRFFRGDQTPLSDWRVSELVLSDPVNIERAFRESAMMHAPFVGQWRFMVIGLFLGFQQAFIRNLRTPGRPCRWRHVGVPLLVFAVYTGGLAGGAALTLADFGGTLPAIDRTLVVAMREGGWKALLLGQWMADLTGLPPELNRPWIYHLDIFVGTGAAIWARYAWRRLDAAAFCFRLLAVLFGGSLFIAAFAIPVDVAARTAEPSQFLTGSFVTLLIAMPMIVWSLWPAVEGLANVALPQAAAFAGGQRFSIGTGDYVSRAHTLSLTLLFLGLLGWQVGLLHSSRTRLMTETRELITVELVRAKLPADAPVPPEVSGAKPFQYSRQRRERVSVDIRNDGSLITYDRYLADGHAPVMVGSLWKAGRIRQLAPNTALTRVPLPTFPMLGEIAVFRLGGPPDGRCAPNPCSYVAAVHPPEGAPFITGLFRQSDGTPRQRLKEIARDLDVPPESMPVTQGADEKWEPWLERIQRRLYNWSVPIPLLEGVALPTTSAMWVVTLLGTGTLIILRNHAAIALDAEKVDREQPWLILDAVRPLEKTTGWFWVAGVGLAGPLIIFSLVVVVSESYRSASTPPALPMAVISFGFASMLFLVNLWTGVTTVATLLLLRWRRADANRERLASTSA